jgi:hypothetical protein
MVLYACGWDELREGTEETEVFERRLHVFGKFVGGYIDGCLLKGVVLAWDEFLSFGEGNVKRDDLYAHCRGMF